MSNEYLTLVFRHSKSTGAARCVLLAIANRANKEGLAEMSIADIAHHANCTTDYTSAVLARLDRAGVVKRELRPGHKSRYQIVADMVGKDGDTPPTVSGDTPPTVSGDTPPTVSGDINHINQLTTITVGDVHTAYLENFGQLTPMIAEDLTDYANEFSPQWVVDAMRVAVGVGKRNLRYVGGILRNWKANGRTDKPATAPTPNRQPATPASRIVSVDEAPTQKV